MIRKYGTGEISSGQCYIMLISMMVGTGVLGLARSVAEASQQDAWISILLNGIGISFIVGLIVLLESKFPEITFLQFTSILLTKPIALVIVFLYGVYATLVTSLSIRFLCEMVGTWFLPRTPLFVVSLITVLTLIYITKEGLTLVARFNEIVVFSIVPFIFLIFPSLTEASLLNLKPVGGSGFVNIVKGITPSFYAFAGYEVLLIIYPYIANKNKNNLKYSVLSIFFVTLLYTSIVASQIALFGYQEITDILYSFINYLDVLDFPIIERIEIFFTFFWTFAVLGTLTIQYIVGCIAFQSTLKTKRTNTFVYVLAPVVFILSLLPKNSAQVASLSEMIGKANIGFGVILPILLLLMYLVKRKRVNHEESM
ncbi:spore germination protein [Clostridium aceticum]|uniref:Spore germination protein n=1 Tax=Clostridium aceticum TaxID=84022 RepID=A0A0D8II21_9CLOT|nr:endospore germination permease [Clostridium aceticum]AKL95377.1 spore germination protein [Clostridium aceticum]KJF28816.1 spore gernimation protein [Clostridium aceticum]